MPFLDDLKVLVSGRRYVLTRPFRYRYRGYTIRVPAGFVTDFASIPRIFRWYATGHDNTQRAAVIHDYLYSRGSDYDRKWADQVFLQALEESGVRYFKRYAMYWAVRICGRWSYEKH